MVGIVLEPLKTVYWPIPKCACTALKVHFARLLGIYSGGNPHNEPFEITKEPLLGYKNFALVRNPYARLWSLWVNKIAPGHPMGDWFVDGLDTNLFATLEPGLVWSEMPFTEFAAAILTQPVLDPHWAPQIMQIPQGCDTIKMEDYKELLQNILPQVNKGHIELPWATGYNPALRNLVYNYYREDFEQLGYSDGKTLIVDCDGVLTDGRLTIDHRGEKAFKQFHSRDVRAIRELVFNGWEVVLVSADDWPGLHHFADKVGAAVHFTRDKATLPWLDYVAVGDDAWDVGMLRKARKGFAPADADRSVLELEGVHPLTARGGQGVLAEVCRELLG